jgi:UDPglucose 6-dehydrogenase
MNKVSFIGLGKLGLPLATCMAKNGINIVALDVNNKVIESLNNVKAPFYETNLQNNIELAKENTVYSLNYDLVADTNTTIILVNTPSNKKDGSFSNLYIEQALIEVCKRIKGKSTYHLFVISSTVMPGSIQDSFIPLIETNTNWKLNQEYGLCYIPDFVALGTIIKDFENPEFVVLGQSDQKAGDKALELYSKVFVNNPPIKRMSLIEAEIAKISLNAYICTKISFSNFLTRICEKFDNVNVDNITESIGIDKRISPHYFKGGLSFGGTCFPRDTWAFMKMSEKLGMKAYHIEAAEKLNQEQDRHLLDKVIKVSIDNNLPNKISILGLGFKNNTPVINESASIKLIEKLLNMNYKIYVYDPVEEAVENTKQLFGDKIEYCNTPKECIENSKLCVITNPNKEYENLLSTAQKDSYIIDCWRYYKNKNNLNIINIGKK